MSAAENLRWAEQYIGEAADKEYDPTESEISLQYATAHALVAMAESLHTQNLIGAVAIGAFPNALAEKAARKQIRARLSATTTQGEPA